MSTDLRNLPKPKRDLVKAVQAEYRRVEADLAPRLSAHPHPAMREPEQQALQVAQNTLRTCLEATFQSMGPYSPEACASLAIRLASYALSAAAMEDQDFLLAHVLQHLGAEHMRRVDQGISIQTEWQMQDGSVRPNTGPIAPPAAQTKALSEGQQRMLLDSEPSDRDPSDGAGVELWTGADYAIARSLQRRGLGSVEGPGQAKGMPGLYFNNAAGLEARADLLESRSE